MTISTERIKAMLTANKYRGNEEVYLVAAELLALREARSEPVTWGSPKTVQQLIQQLQTLDPELETMALLRMPSWFRAGNAVKQAPLSISYEKMNGMWLAPYSGNGRTVLAFWVKPDDRMPDNRGKQLTVPLDHVEPDEQLICIANHIEAAAGALPDEWQDWASELVSDLRRLAVLPTQGHVE